MVSKTTVDDFLARRTLAVVGVSREGKKFGSTVYKELKSKGYTVFAINPKAEKIGDDPCYPDLRSLPEPVEGVVVVVPPAQTEQVMRQVVESGIPRVWLQQGAESETAIRYGEEHGISVVHNECILMFAEPAAFPHRLHRWIWKILGKLPK
jgi:predicted CoA-binding protein